MPKGEDTDLDEGSPRRVDVQLFIVHPTISPAEITAALGLEARFAHRVGDPRKTHRGRLLKGNYPDTRWRHSIRYELRGQWFADKVTVLADRLLPHKEFLHSIRDAGGEAQIIIAFLGDGYLGGHAVPGYASKNGRVEIGFWDRVLQCSSILTDRLVCTKLRSFADKRGEQLVQARLKSYQSLFLAKAWPEPDFR